MEERNYKIHNIDEFDKRLEKMMKHTKTISIPTISNCYFFNEDPEAYSYIDYSKYDESVLWVKPSVLMWYIKEYIYDSKVRNLSKIAVYEAWRPFAKDGKYTRGLDDGNPFYYFEVLDTSEDGKVKTVEVWHDGVIAVVRASWDPQKVAARSEGAIILESVEEKLHLESYVLPGGF